jgi:hypothetical protein
MLRPRKSVMYTVGRFMFALWEKKTFLFCRSVAAHSRLLFRPRSAKHVLFTRSSSTIDRQFFLCFLSPSLFFFKSFLIKEIEYYVVLHAPMQELYCRQHVDTCIPSVVYLWYLFSIYFWHLLSSCIPIRSTAIQILNDEDPDVCYIKESKLYRRAPCVRICCCSACLFKGAGC